MLNVKEKALSQSERLRTVCQDRGNSEEVIFFTCQKLF